MTNKTIYKIGGLVFFFFSVIGLSRDLEEFQTQQNGKSIEARISYVPMCLIDTKLHFRFEYMDNGTLKEYSKRVSGERMCEKLRVGQIIKLKANLEKKIFLIEGGNMTAEFYAMGLFAISGIFCFVYGFKK